MSKYLITGFSGFVGEHFLDFLNEKKEDDIILGIDIKPPDFLISNYKNLRCRYEQIDMLNKNELEKIIYQFCPDYVLHLASYSSVAYSWKNPVASFANNTNIFLNLLEAIRLTNARCRILSVGSSEEYGRVDAKDLPLKEDHKDDPVSPYGVARVFQEMLSKVYIQGFNLNIFMTRSFNHIGAGQKEIFVVSSFAKQFVLLAKSGPKEGILTTGDITIVRDFVDVRDVVKAYNLLFTRGKHGEIYNVCNGHGIALSRIIDMMSDKLKLKIKLKQDSSLVRPTDNMVIIGSNEKIKEHTGWQSNIPIEQSIDDILHCWNNIINGYNI